MNTFNLNAVEKTLIAICLFLILCFMMSPPGYLFKCALIIFCILLFTIAILLLYGTHKKIFKHIKKTPARIIYKKFLGDELGSPLHCETGPAIKYADGKMFWYLNGVRVPRWLAETPAEKISCKKIFNLDDLGQCAEFVKKIGIERIADEIAEKIEIRNGYELLRIELYNNRFVIYLKMRDPSTGEWYIEGVDNKCRTIRGALSWQNGTHEVPEIIT